MSVWQKSLEFLTTENSTFCPTQEFETGILMPTQFLIGRVTEGLTGGNRSGQPYGYCSYIA